MVNLTFLRVPEIHDGFEYKFFISQAMTVSEVIERVTEELGLTKSLPVPDGGNLEYVAEEVWLDKNSESMVYHAKVLIVQLTDSASQGSQGFLHHLPFTTLSSSHALPTHSHPQQGAYSEFVCPTNGTAAQSLAVCPQPPWKHPSRPSNGLGLWKNQTKIMKTKER